MTPSYQDRVQAIPPVLRGVLFVPSGLLALGLTIYWWIYQSGIYGWLMDLQLSMIGGYYRMYTGVFTLLITGFLCMIPAMVIVFILVQLEVFPVQPVTPPVIHPTNVPLPPDAMKPFDPSPPRGPDDGIRPPPPTDVTS
jgi:hypothetical protein